MQRRRIAFFLSSLKNLWTTLSSLDKNWPPNLSSKVWPIHKNIHVRKTENQIWSCILTRSDLLITVALMHGAQGKVLLWQSWERDYHQRFVQAKALMVLQKHSCICEHTSTKEGLYVLMVALAASNLHSVVPDWTPASSVFIISAGHPTSKRRLILPEIVVVSHFWNECSVRAGQNKIWPWSKNWFRET